MGHATPLYTLFHFEVKIFHNVFNGENSKKWCFKWDDMIPIPWLHSCSTVMSDDILKTACNEREGEEDREREGEWEMERERKEIDREGECERERRRESICVREREGDRERESVCVRERKERVQTFWECI